MVVGIWPLEPEHLERDSRGQSERRNEVHQARRERALVLMRERTDGREHRDACEGQPKDLRVAETTAPGLPRACASRVP